MATIFSWYFKQPVQHGELAAAFGALQTSDQALASDLGFFGIIAHGAVAQHTGTPNLTVDIEGGGIVYDQTGQRISWPTTETVDVSQDSNHVSTTVVGVGNERWVTVFAHFIRVLSDPRIDGSSNTIEFRQDEGFEFLVDQGAEAAIGLAVVPNIHSDAVLLADINLRHGDTAVLNAAINIARRQDAIALAGTPLSIRRGRVKDAIDDLLIQLNSISGSLPGITLPASQINYAGGPNWADGTANPAVTVEAQLDRIASVLGSGAGTGKIQGTHHVGTLFDLPADTLTNQLEQLRLKLDVQQRLLSRRRVTLSVSVPAVTSTANVLHTFADATYNTGNAFQLASFTPPFAVANGQRILYTAHLSMLCTLQGIIGAKLMWGGDGDLAEEFSNVSPSGRQTSDGGVNQFFHITLCGEILIADGPYTSMELYVVGASNGISWTLLSETSFEFEQWTS